MAFRSRWRVKTSDLTTAQDTSRTQRLVQISFGRASIGSFQPGIEGTSARSRSMGPLGGGTIPSHSFRQRWPDLISAGRHPREQHGVRAIRREGGRTTHADGASRNSLTAVFSRIVLEGLLSDLRRYYMRSAPRRGANRGDDRTWAGGGLEHGRASSLWERLKEKRLRFDLSINRAPHVSQDLRVALEGVTCRFPRAGGRRRYSVCLRDEWPVEVAMAGRIVQVTLGRTSGLRRVSKGDLDPFAVEGHGRNKKKLGIGNSKHKPMTFEEIGGVGGDEKLADLIIKAGARGPHHKAWSLNPPRLAGRWFEYWPGGSPIRDREPRATGARSGLGCLSGEVRDQLDAADFQARFGAQKGGNVNKELRHVPQFTRHAGIQGKRRRSRGHGSQLFAGKRSGRYGVFRSFPRTREFQGTGDGNFETPGPSFRGDERRVRLRVKKNPRRVRDLFHGRRRFGMTTHRRAAEIS